MSILYRQFELRYDQIVVGIVENAYEGDSTTWFGRFRKSFAEPHHESVKRLEAFIDLCLDWDARDAKGGEPSAAEFDAFSDLLHSGLWSVCEAEGQPISIEPPMFFNCPDENISWRTEDVESGREKGVRPIY